FEKVRPQVVMTEGRLDVKLLTSVDKQMLRDGVQPKPVSGKGERAWWMIQMLGAIPPSTWQTQFQRNATELVQAAKEGEWEALLLEAWSEAAVRHQDRTCQ